MTFGEEPVPIVVEAFNVSMILYAEHSFNASTFTARVITSTLSDLHSAVAGAIGALKGPLHGGAERGRHAHLRRDRHPARGVAGGGGARAKAGWSALRPKKKVMGFGHRVYKHGDSRVPTMKAALDKLIEHYGRPDCWALQRARERRWTSARASSRTSTTRGTRVPPDGLRLSVRSRRTTASTSGTSSR